MIKCDNMKNIEFDKQQIIFLKAKLGATVSKALHEAIDFCKTNMIDECELNFFGYIFEITPKSNFAEMQKEYMNSIAYKTNAGWVGE
jgi:hypothetical protein